MLAFAPRNRGNLLENYIQTGSQGLGKLYPDITLDLKQILERLPQSMSMASVTSWARYFFIHVICTSWTAPYLIWNPGHEILAGRQQRPLASSPKTYASYFLSSPTSHRFLGNL